MRYAVMIISDGDYNKAVASIQRQEEIKNYTLGGQFNGALRVYKNSECVRYVGKLKGVTQTKYVVAYENDYRADHCKIKDLSNKTKTPFGLIVPNESGGFIYSDACQYGNPQDWERYFNNVLAKYGKTESTITCIEVKRL